MQSTRSTQQFILPLFFLFPPSLPFPFSPLHLHTLYLLLMATFLSSCSSSTPSIKLASPLLTFVMERVTGLKSAVPFVARDFRSGLRRGITRLRLRV